jgi:hypothetical protein
MTRFCFINCNNFQNYRFSHFGGWDEIAMLWRYFYQLIIRQALLRLMQLTSYNLFCFEKLARITSYHNMDSHFLVLNFAASKTGLVQDDTSTSDNEDENAPKSPSLISAKSITKSTIVGESVSAWWISKHDIQLEEDDTLLRDLKRTVLPSITSLDSGWDRRGDCGRLVCR